ncbi:MAG: hypothetical protein ACREQ3_17480, partial [Candidatus Binatia bacterium]
MLRCLSIHLLAVLTLGLTLLFGAVAVSAQSDLPVWGLVPSPNRGPLANTLKGIAAVSTNDIWAVGEFNPGIPPTATGRRT